MPGLRTNTEIVGFYLSDVEGTKRKWYMSMAPNRMLEILKNNENGVTEQNARLYDTALDYLHNKNRNI